ncbi:Spondin-1 [Frankliniella fusca]|uniref:Spondin-1 n=1 Tax=Frankliniella fusca TaxID=407009 RepID=A0AAE1HL68_9NEOP|nr:Spondin-1 [Frankliniella fusca]
MRVRGPAALSERAPLLPLLLELLLVALVLPWGGATPRCGAPTENTLPSNNRFAVVLSGGPKTYVPGQTYRVSVEGQRDGEVALKFIGFVLTVEPEDDGLGRRREVGRFTLYPDALAKFDERCANTVTHANLLPSSEVYINWTAPPEGAGCVVFRGAVQESPHTWYADELMDSALTQRVCEDTQENMDEQRPILETCTACDEAKYEVTFEGLWSRHTHPKDFPADSWVTRFSDVIGASHDVEYRFWEYNGMASEGLKQVAERGTTRALETELKAESDHIRTIIKARGISYPNVTGKTFAVFRVDQKNHLMSLVSMIDPSPDWIVGVSGLELCLSNGSWVDHVQLNLYPFDAGTDSGLTYIAPDQPTVPQEPIRKMSSSFPNTEASPFFDSTGEPMRPMARLSLVRQRLYEKSCDEQGRLSVEGEDHDSVNREDCEVGEWGPWTECPVTCGRGTRHRQRFYLKPDATERGCKRVVTLRQQCYSTRMRQCPDLGGYGNAEDDPECELTPWTAWSTCSATCGQGTRTRSRRFKHRAGKRCAVAKNPPLLQQNEPCLEEEGAGAHCAASGASEPSEPGSGPGPGGPGGGCLLSEWSQWSVCSASCGRGEQHRERMVISNTEDGAGPCANVRMQEHVFCVAETPSCHLSPEQARDVCRLSADPGPCRGHLQRWFYHPDSQLCHAFEYGGCRGNKNNFATLAECERVCSANRAGDKPPLTDRPEALEKYGVRLSGAITYSAPIGKDTLSLNKAQRHHNAHHHHHHVSKHHGAHAAGSASTAGPAAAPTPGPFGSLETDSHMASVAPVRGCSGYGCPGPDDDFGMARVTTGVMGDVVDCQLSEWSRWGSCDATCGVGYKSRTRTILVSPQNGGRACEKKLLARRRCRLPPCADSLLREQNDQDDEDDGLWGSYHKRENDCVMSEWSEWSQCTSSCGINAQKIRSRRVEREQGPGGRACGPRSEVRSCMLLPCPR